MSYPKAILIVRILAALAASMAVGSIGGAVVFAAFAPSEGTSPVLALCAAAAWFTRIAYRGWRCLSPAVIGELIMSFGLFVMLAPLPLLIHVANVNSDSLVITEAPVLGVLFPVSVYLIVLSLAIWGCRSLSRSLARGLVIRWQGPA